MMTTRRGNSKTIDRMERGIALLEEEWIRLLVKSSMVLPGTKSMLICFVWTKKLYNPDSFKAQMTSIWKTRKKFEIQSLGQNLFSIWFEEEEDLELILARRPWLFHKQVVLFERLTAPIKRSKIRLVMSPFWIKVRHCSPECNKEDLMSAVGSMFGGSNQTKIKGDYCRLKVVKCAKASS